MHNITCPHCGKAIELTQALSGQIAEKVRQTEQEKHKKELEEVRKEALDSSAKKFQDQFALTLQQTQEETAAKDTRIKDLIQQITERTKEVRLSKQEKEEAELTMQKKLLEEEEKIRLDAQKKAEQEQNLKLAEKDKLLQDALRQNEEMRRKLQQGSQQLQGEAFEVEFENLFQREFINDKILPIGKGMRGGDVVQEVWDRNGNYCGKILWELKNTKIWSEQWIDKVKVDQRSVTAEYAAVVSEVVPPHVESAKFYKNIWVTKRNFVIALACSLRLNLIQVAMAKRAAEGKKEKMNILYSYLLSTEFKHRIEAIVEAFTSMQHEIEKEKRYFSNKWARDEKNIRQVIDNTYGMHGDLKGIIGNALPQIRGLDESLELKSDDSPAKTNL